MKNKTIKTIKIINEKEIRLVYENNLPTLMTEWFELQMLWLNAAYKNFKDHDKFLILIYIVKKTFDHYASNLVNLNFQEFYNLEKVEIAKFNTIEISKKLNISRETTRRKIHELEKSGIIEKNKKTLLVRNAAFQIQNPENIISSVIQFLNRFSKICEKNNILENELSNKEIENCLLAKFSYAWKMWYEMLIPNLVIWKKFYVDLETYHIFGAVVVNQAYETSKILKKKNMSVSNRNEYLQMIRNIDSKTGINAMSISVLTGIPRATVIRKLKDLLKKKKIVINDKKLYFLKSEIVPQLGIIQSKIIDNLSNFTTKSFNLVRFN